MQWLFPGSARKKELTKDSGEEKETYERKHSKNWKRRKTIAGKLTQLQQCNTNNNGKEEARDPTPILQQYTAHGCFGNIKNEIISYLASRYDYWLSYWGGFKKLYNGVPSHFFSYTPFKRQTLKCEEIRQKEHCYKKGQNKTTSATKQIHLLKW